MKTLKEDFFSPLDKVERNWLRKSATILVGAIALIAIIPAGIFEAIKFWWDDFIVDCWRGSQKKDNCEHDWEELPNMKCYARQCRKCGILSIF